MTTLDVPSFDRLPAPQKEAALAWMDRRALSRVVHLRERPDGWIDATCLAPDGEGRIHLDPVTGDVVQQLCAVPGPWPLP